MSFIAKNPLTLPKIEISPSAPQGTRGIFAKEDGWYDIDSDGVIKKLGGDTEAILDPDNAIEKIDTIPMEIGGLNPKTGELDVRHDAIRSIDYLPITPGKTIFFTSSLPVGGSDHQVRALFYDADYNWVGRVYLELNTDLVVKSDWRYLRIYRSDTSDTTVEMALVTKAKPEFKKIYFADHGYSIYGADIDDEMMHKLVIEALGKDDNVYNIVELKAPEESPEEASLALMNKGDDIFQFVDFSSMVYDEDNPTVEIVCQTRGGRKLPEFSVRYNDGEGAGRVKKFVVKPDCIPMTLTSEGIRVRRNNNYDNKATEEELVTVNLAELHDMVYDIERRLPRKITIDLPVSAWVDAGVDEYSQVVSIEKSTQYSQIDLQIGREELAIFREKEISFWVENENGTITVFCMGQKPTIDYVIQATKTEVVVDE